MIATVPNLLLWVPLVSGPASAQMPDLTIPNAGFERADGDQHTAANAANPELLGGDQVIEVAQGDRKRLRGFFSAD